MPHPLDEYPLHQVALSMAHVATSDRNAYDRCYFNAHGRAGDPFLVTGLGVYPNLGVVDAFATVRTGDRQVSVRASGALEGCDRLAPAVGPFRVEVVEPLQRVRLVCDGDEHGLGFDLAWTGSFPAVDEVPHVWRAGPRIALEAQRFAQVGTWEGTLRVDCTELAVTSDRWLGTRDRSWGVRPIGEPDPAGRLAEAPTEGFWWLYLPLRFEEFAVVVIVQEDPDGHRVLNEATRVWPAAAGRRPEQLGWPDVHVRYQPGTRLATGATVELRERGGRTLALDVESLGYVALNAGSGYGGDPSWAHGTWRGEDWVEGVVHTLHDPAVAGMLPFGVIDHVGRATLDGAEGWGLFEHASMGRHDPSGFADYAAVAP